MRHLLIASLLSVVLLACGDNRQHADLIVKNARIYTMDPSFTVLESFAIRDGKITGVGTNVSIEAAYESNSVLDLGGKTVLPGLIDAHCHFLGYATGLRECNLVGTKSFEEVLQRVQEFAKTNKRKWIVGRGWDQNDWENKSYPDRKILDSLFPNTPVLLDRIDGHASLANGKALELAGINDSTEISGGEILKYQIASEGRARRNTVVSGPPTGILIDNAADRVKKIIPPLDDQMRKEAILEAQKNCFAVGLTTVDDAGLMKEDVEYLKKMEAAGELKMRMYIMLSDSAPNYAHYLSTGPYKSEHLNVRAFKFYADGALGSRGACLLEPYSDLPGHYGFLLSSMKHYEEKMKLLRDKGFQVATHCIGDSANRVILKLYGQLLGEGNDARWRIEHAQVVDPSDRQYFKKYGIIPSVQPTHATSDMYWAQNRLGEKRIASAYTYKSLLQDAGTLCFGTDFPVEHISPWYTLYSAVSRTDRKGYPEGGFNASESLDRKSALYAMTTWAAWSNFEESEKGAIAPGMVADFIVTDLDPLNCPADKIPDIRVLQTWSSGKQVYSQQ